MPIANMTPFTMFLQVMVITTCVISCFGQDCPPDFRFHKDQCYQVLKKQVSFIHAKYACSRLGAKLAQVTTWREHDAMEHYTKDVRKAGQYSWLLMEVVSDRRSGGTFALNVPRFNNLRFHIQNFKNKNELQDGKGDCVVIKPDTYWNRYNCDAKAYAVCVKPNVDEYDLLEY